MNFSETSKVRLSSCHPDLQRLFCEVVVKYDCTILCGFRNEADQNQAFEDGTSTSCRRWQLMRFHFRLIGLTIGASLTSPDMSRRLRTD